jgi:DNA-binding MarR family transcriptional regulator
MSATTNPTPTFSTPLLGQTEKALNAILARQLAGTGLDELQWVTLTLTQTLAGSGSIERDELVARLVADLKVSEAQALALVTALAAARLLAVADGDGSPVKITEAGRQLHAKIRTAVTEIIQRMWGDLPADDLAVAARVLSVIRERANAELAAA